MKTTESVNRQVLIEAAYDLNEIAHYYLLYNDLMRHWHAVLSGLIFDLDYEQLVYDPEGQVEKLLRHCRLEWSERCLTFHNSNRAVHTASTVQVLRPIYRDSIELWKNYERHLICLKNIMPMLF